ncbi:MAG: Hsp20/alpha crystallin family protein [bacterium]
MLIFRFNTVKNRFEIAGVSGVKGHSHSGFHPPVDISFYNGVFIVRVDLPGVERENLSIEVEENEISIIGEVPKPDKHGPCRLMERPSGVFVRTLGFPGRIAPDKVEAELINGVLILKIPAPESETEPTRVVI